MAVRPEIFERVRRKFIKGLPGRVRVLQQAIASSVAGADDDSHATIRRLAHQVRGTAGSIGFDALGILAESTETSAESALLERARALVAAMLEIMARHSAAQVRILVIDDDELIGDQLEALLYGRSHSLTRVPTVEAAMRALDEPGEWHLFVVDLMLPDGDGRVILPAIRGNPRYEHTPVIVLSAKSSALVKNECAAYGVDQFIEKPIDVSTLPALVTAALERGRAVLEEALTEPLTGLTNRAGLRNSFVATRALCRRNGVPISVALADIDHFKRFNDAYGHAAGDDALKAVAEATKQVLRRSDLVARWGGEEFVLVFPEATAEQALVPLGKLAEDLRGRRVVFSQASPLTFSAGVAMAQGDESLDMILLRCDQLLYQAKHLGRDRRLCAPVPSDGQRKRILVAEDDVDFARLLLADLSGQYEVVLASDCGQALEFAREEGPFALLLLDHQMPSGSGVDVIGELRRDPSWKATPMLLMTAAGSDDLVESAFESGADDFVHKPYRKRQLLARIARHLARDPR